MDQEEEEDDTRASPDEDLVSLIMQATALPQNSDTQFMAATGQQPVLSFERPAQITQMLPQLLQKLGQSPQLMKELYVQMINEGNNLDIACELKRQISQGLGGRGGYGIWQAVAASILSVADLAVFHFSRIYVMAQPFAQNGGYSRADAIDNVKDQILDLEGAPSGIDIDEINWDAVSYKVPILGSEYFCQLEPSLVHALDQSHVSIINEFQKQAQQIVEMKCSQYRGADQVPADEFIPDSSLFLESKFAAVTNRERQFQIENMGDNNLIDYIRMAQPLFVQGMIPGTIAPGKIAACQDVISATEIRAAIQQLAEVQILQKQDIMGNPNVRYNMKLIADGTSGFRDRWSQKQTASINQARFTDIGMGVGERSIGQVSYTTPQKELKKQIAGGANTLHDQLDMQRDGSIVNQSITDKELLRHHLSILLACIRIRFDATQNTKNELVAQEDVDHLYMVKKLSQHTDRDSQQKLYELSNTLAEAIVNGHNRAKFEGHDLPPEIADEIEISIEGHATNILRVIPFFNSDLQENGEYYQKLIKCIFISLAQGVRLEVEMRDRCERRDVLFRSTNQYTQYTATADEEEQQYRGQQQQQQQPPEQYQQNEGDEVQLPQDGQ